MQERYGLTPYVMDATVLAGGAGRVAGSLARTRGGQVLLEHAGRPGRATARVAKAPKAQRELRRAEVARNKAERRGDAQGVKQAEERVQKAAGEVRRTQRRSLRWSGGEGGVHAQRTSRNLITAAGQRYLDVRRGKHFDKKLERAGAELDPHTGNIRPRPGVEPEEITKLPGLRPGHDEVIPLTGGVLGRSIRETPLLRRFTGRAARDVGEAQSETRMRMLSYMARGHKEIQKRLQDLDKPEARALKYMMEFGSRRDRRASSGWSSVWSTSTPRARLTRSSAWIRGWPTRSR